MPGSTVQCSECGLVEGLRWTPASGYLPTSPPQAMIVKEPQHREAGGGRGRRGGGGGSREMGSRRLVGHRSLYATARSLDFTCIADGGV